MDTLDLGPENPEKPEPYRTIPVTLTYEQFLRLQDIAVTIGTGELMLAQFLLVNKIKEFGSALDTMRASYEKATEGNLVREFMECYERSQRAEMEIQKKE